MAPTTLLIGSFLTSLKIIVPYSSLELGLSYRYDKIDFDNSGGTATNLSQLLNPGMRCSLNESLT